MLPSAQYRPTRLVVDAALRRIGKSGHGGHKTANISLTCFVAYYYACKFGLNRLGSNGDIRQKPL